MAIIDYDKWMKDTARFGLSRSAELKAVDAAFLAHEKLGTPASKRGLEQAFGKWKEKSGPGNEWMKSARNNSRAAEKLQSLLSGVGDEDGAFSKGRAPEFMHEDLINARLGVLYLFSRLSVAPGIFKILLEGGLDLADNAMELGGVDKAVQDNFKKAAKSKGVVGSGLNKLENKLIPQNTGAKNMSLPDGQAPSVVAKPVTISSTQLLTNANAQQPPAQNSILNQVKEKLNEWFNAVVDKLLELIKKKFGTLEGIKTTVLSLVKGVVAMVLKKFVPFGGAAMDIAKGLGKTLDAAVTRFQTWQDGRGVEVNQGHPATIVDSITRAMNLSIFEGLWVTLKGAGALAIDITGFGAGAIVNVVVSATEMLIKFIWRLAETIVFNRFCMSARHHWDNQVSSEALHRAPFAFSEWYRSSALNIPLIAVLTLNTGICGDKMRYLTMFNSGGDQITSEQFQQGVRFLDNLKPWGSKYIKDSGFTIRASNDPLVDGLVNKLAKSHEEEKTAFDHFIKFIT